MSKRKGESKKKEIANYKQRIIETIRFHEVDILGVCNNAIYFNYFEDARIKYVQDIKKIFSLKKILEVTNSSSWFTTIVIIGHF